MEPIVCLICHEAVRVPVRFTCFRCPHPPGKQACNDMIRVCLICARQYLELNKAKNQRAYSRKCLMCPAEVHPSHLNAERAYAKDFLLMSMDTRNYPCFHLDKGCEFNGTQQDLDRHIQGGCDYRMMACPELDCPGVFYAKDLDQHRRTSCYRYIKCELCADAIHMDHVLKHMLDAHNMRPCQYCRKFNDLATIEGHKEACPDRKKPCIICHLEVRQGSYKQHLHDHVAVCAQQIENKSQQVANLTKEITNYNQQLRMAMEGIMKIP